MEKSFKQRKGITLIALVITIIVLLILAGVSISMIAGENGILQKATEAKTNTEKAQIIENAQMDISGQQADNNGSNITKEQLVTILNKYFQDTEASSIPDEVSSEQGHDYELTTKDNQYIIKLSEIYRGKFSAEESEDIITFYCHHAASPETRESFTAREGMTFGQWIEENPTAGFSYTPDSFIPGPCVQYRTLVCVE